MKQFYRLLLLLSLLLTSGLNLRAEFEPPTEAQLDQLLANPKLVNATIKDANGKEAAGVMIRIINRLEEVDLVDVQLNYLAAYYSARIAFLLPSAQAATFATELVNTAPQELIPPIMAALSMGAGGVPQFGAHLLDIAGDNEAYVQAVRNPRIPLTPPVFNLLSTSLGTTQTLPPVVTDSLPPPIPVGIPDGTVEGTATPTPAPTPVIPDTYDGQG